MKNTTKAHLAVLGTNLFFAANFSFVKLISPHFIKPFALNGLRVGVSVLLFWVIWLAGKTPAGIQRKDVGRFVLCALTGVAINQMLFIKGLTMTSTVHASLLMLTTPLLIAVFAFLVLKEMVTKSKVAGLVLGIGGALLLILSKENTAHAANYLLGDILILVNAISYSVYFILVKPLMERYSPLQVIRWVFTIGMFMVLPFAWSELGDLQFRVFGPGEFAALAAVIITGTFLAYLFNAYGIQHLGAGITGTYIYTQPLFAVLIATFLLGEELSAAKTIAALMIFTGVYLVSFKKTKARSSE
ncbi:MAG TPA: DMT family transporter [Flavisolibacter sp.]|nr:DMT family transporter [Flavisolibacter sp.]